MHRTQGDGYSSALNASGQVVNVYADEDLGSGRDATQVRHEEVNAFQEEICNVIEGEGIVLQSPAESVSTMNQLNTAINNKLKSDRIANQSTVSGGMVTEALSYLRSSIETEESDRISGDGSLQYQLNSLSANNVDNDSAVPGSTVKDALNNLSSGEVKESVWNTSASIYWGLPGSILGNVTLNLHRISDQVTIHIEQIDVVPTTGAPSIGDFILIDLTNAQFEPFLCQNITKNLDPPGLISHWTYYDAASSSSNLYPCMIEAPDETWKYIKIRPMDPVTGAFGNFTFYAGDHFTMLWRRSFSYLTGHSRPAP